MKVLLSILLVLISPFAVAQSACTVVGPSGYSGPVTQDIVVYCGTTIPPVIQPPPPPPAGECAESQLSTPVNGVTFKRQCSGQVFMLPKSDTYSGDLTDLGTVLGNTSYPRYAYAGFSPTIQIQSGYYVALAFTPNATGAVQFSANVSYGDGGTIAVSTTPGGITRGATGVVCVLNYGASNGMYISTTAPICPVKAGQTYYLNFADTDANGSFLCYGGTAGACSSSVVSYTLYTSK